MKATDFHLLDWLTAHSNIEYNLGSSCITFLKLTDFPGFDAETFDFTLDCGADMGDPLLKQEIAAQYSVDPVNVAITSSASEGNFLVEALFSPGTFLLETPTYEPLWRLAQVFGSKVIFTERRYDQHYMFSLEGLKEKAGNASLLIFTNLHNPSGVALDQRELKSIVDICEDHGTMILVDEIFRQFADVPSAVNFSENVIVNSSPSKFFGGCGLRIGHLVGPAELIREVERLKMILSPNTSVISQRAYLLMMQTMDWFMRWGRGMMESTIELVSRWMEERDDIEWVPSEGNIAFPKILNPETGEIVNTMELGTFLAREYHVLITPGKYFGIGDEGHIRLAYGKKREDIEPALECLSLGLDNWWEK